MREHARSIGLVHQFEREPGSVKLREGEQRDAVVERVALGDMLGV
jgi:hypothetical protein